MAGTTLVLNISPKNAIEADSYSMQVEKLLAFLGTLDVSVKVFRELPPSPICESTEPIDSLNNSFELTPYVLTSPFDSAKKDFSMPLLLPNVYVTKSHLSKEQVHAIVSRIALQTPHLSSSFLTTQTGKSLFPYNSSNWSSPKPKNYLRSLMKRQYITLDTIAETLNLEAPLKRLTHDISLLYLCHHFQLSTEKFFETSENTLNSLH
jgi:hypothetical protein